MKIRRATVNQKKSQIELVTYSGRTYPMPLSRLSPTPSPTNQLVSAQVDPELDREAVTFVLESGEEGVLHIDQALDYNRDPGYLAEMLTHKLTVEARHRVDASGLSRRELARRLKTSLPQLYRLLDPTNTSKSLAQLISLLRVVGYDVDFVVRPYDAPSASDVSLTRGSAA